MAAVSGAAAPFALRAQSFTSRIVTHNPTVLGWISGPEPFQWNVGGSLVVTARCRKELLVSMIQGGPNIDTGEVKMAMNESPKYVFSVEVDA